MFGYLSLTGMAFIVLSWIIQIVKLAKGNKEMCRCFAVMQFVGIVLIAVESFITGSIALGIGNALSALGAITVAIMIGKCNCCCKDKCEPVNAVKAKK